MKMQQPQPSLIRSTNKMIKHSCWSAYMWANWTCNVKLAKPKQTGHVCSPHWPNCHFASHQADFPQQLTRPALRGVPEHAKWMRLINQANFKNLDKRLKTCSKIYWKFFTNLWKIQRMKTYHIDQCNKYNTYTARLKLEDWSARSPIHKPRLQSLCVISHWDPTTRAEGHVWARLRSPPQAGSPELDKGDRPQKIVGSTPRRSQHPTKNKGR